MPRVKAYDEMDEVDRKVADVEAKGAADGHGEPYVPEVLEWNPERDLAPQQKSGGGKQYKAFIHPQDPVFRRGDGSFHFKWASSHSDSPEAYDRNLQKNYADEFDMRRIVEAEVQKRVEEESKSLIKLQKKLTEFGAEFKDSPGARKVRNQINRIRTGTIYAWRHVRTGIWPSRDRCLQGQINKVPMQDDIYVRPFASVEEIQKENDTISPVEARPYDGRFRSVRPVWVQIVV